MIVKILCDKQKLAAGIPSKGTVAALQNMLEWGAEIRMRSPHGSIYAAHHQKAWCFDDCVSIIGSHNLTSNSAERCDEGALVTKALSTVQEFNQEFERLWAKSEPVVPSALRPKTFASSDSSERELSGAPEPKARPPKQGSRPRA